MSRARRAVHDAALAEGEALVAVLKGLSTDDWDKPTDCTEWTVRDMTAHLVGQAEGTRNPLVMLRRMRVGARRFPDRTGLDAYTAQQVAEHDGEPGPSLADRFAALWPQAVRTMRLTPGIARAVAADSGVPGAGKFTLGYLFDSILPRDLWMHRVDLSRAIGAPMRHSDHEALILGDVMRDLQRAWRGPAVALHLTGPPGGTFVLGSGTPVAQVEAEAVDYLRALAGRNAAPELTLIDGDGSVLPALAAARVVF